MNKITFKSKHLIWGLILQSMTIMAENLSAGSQASMEMEQKLTSELTSETQECCREKERDQTVKDWFLKSQKPTPSDIFPPTSPYLMIFPKHSINLDQSTIFMHLLDSFYSNQNNSLTGIHRL